MLYDLDADPDEMVNLAAGGRAPDVRTAMTDVMVDALLRADDLTERSQCRRDEPSQDRR